jgi:hypothetical protein
VQAVASSVDSVPNPKPDTPSPAMLRKVAIASCIGSTVEWYDFFIYATASALVFNKLFFPDLSPLVGSLVALGTYAAASWHGRSAVWSSASSATEMGASPLWSSRS